ncbi:MAG TPA: glucose-1-phosphate adenylyltransferase [Saprospiraceae bacterium]|nr:glucose-1-phosphate adenylyltransferase [Saprospiraceae bacterium]
MNSKTMCLILGGGAGSRLYPLTEMRSKPAVPIAGKYRLIDIPISNCLNSDLRRIFVLTQFNSASLNSHIKNTYHFDHFGTGFVELLAAEQTLANRNWFQGTADAVRQTLPRLQNYEYDTLLILSGDHLYQMDYRQFLDTHRKTEADISIATIPVGARDAPDFGIMKVTVDGIVEAFIEKPNQELLPQWKSVVAETYQKQSKVFLASMGIYVFKKEVLCNLLEQNPLMNDFGKEIIPLCIEKKYKIASHPFDGYWTDIGTIRSFFNAVLHLADPLPEFNLFDNERTIYTRARMLSPSKIFGTSCERALIAEGCIIHAKSIYRSVIGIRSRIGRNAELSNSYVMGQDYYQDIAEILDSKRIPMGIGENCHIENAILDRNVCIGNDVIIKGSTDLEDTEQDTYCIKDGIVVVRKGVILAAGTQIGAV